MSLQTTGEFCSLEGVRPGDTIKVGLPGESLWAKVTGLGHDGVVAVLQNEPVHEHFSWGDRVRLGTDNYTVVEPRGKVAAVEKDIAAWRQGLG